jgi:hypothetical protein
MTTRLLKRWLATGAVVETLALGACGTMGMGRNEQTWTMNGAETVPAAEGTVKVAAEKDGNTKVKLQVKHLALPSAAFDESSTYVVWLKPDDGGAPQNVGVLFVDKNLKGNLETRTGLKEFEVMVTAEHTSEAVTPSERVVMNAKVVVPI